MSVEARTAEIVRQTSETEDRVAVVSRREWPVPGADTGVGLL